MIYSNFLVSFINIRSVGDYIKRTSMPDASEYGVVYTHSPANKTSGIGSPILDRMTLVNTGKKKSFADIVRS